MGRTTIRGGRLAETGEITDLKVEDGLVAGVAASSSDAEVVDAGGLTLFPGFIDVHCHGAVGIDVNEADFDGLVEVAKFLTSKGVTAWMPTLVPDSDENYRRLIAAVDRLMEVQAEMPIAQAVGVHYEGVFANEKMCGALRPEYFKSGGDWATARSGLSRLRSGHHMTTLAPEVEGGIELIEGMVRDGWIASIGHTRSDIATLDRAFDAGARHVTHFFNAMTGIHHRDVGVAGWALTKAGVTFDIIADGIHVHPSMLGMAIRQRTPREAILISDSVAPTGLGDGTFDLWGERISVTNGRTRNERGSIAGSVISMLEAVTLVRSLGFADGEVAAMASANPARLLGDDSRGSISVGKRADIVGIDPDGKIGFVMIGGKLVDA